MPRAKELLLWCGSVLLALTISCAAPSKSTKPDTTALAPTPEQVEATPTEVLPEATPTPEPAPAPVVKRKAPPADSGLYDVAKRTAPASPPEQPASTVWSKIEEPETQAPESEQASAGSGDGLTNLQPATPLSDEPAPRSSRAGSWWLVLLGVAVVVFAVVIWMSSRRQAGGRLAKVEEKHRPIAEARPAERPHVTHVTHEAKPTPVVHAKEQTEKQLVLPEMPETHRPAVRVAASTKKTSGRRKTVARKSSRSRKEGPRRAAAARRRSAATGRRKVVSLAKRPASRRKA